MVEVYIELTSCCNFNCAFCPQHLMSRKKRFLSLEHLYLILDQLKERVQPDFIMFSAFGEPLMHPGFTDACRMVKDFGFRLRVTTNGSLLDLTPAASLTCDTLYISFRSASEREFFHRGAEGISFRNYRDIIKRFTDSSRNEIVLYLMGTGAFKPLRHNKGFMDIKMDYADKNSVLRRINKIGKYFEPAFQEIGVETLDPGYNQYIPLRPGLYLYLDQLYNWCNLIMPAGYSTIQADYIDPQSCDYHKNHIVVFANGDLSFCCMDYDARMVQGNLFSMSLDEILEKRDKVIDLAAYKLCRKCRGRVVRSKGSSRSAKDKRAKVTRTAGDGIKSSV